jgi:hypothetical protein
MCPHALAGRAEIFRIVKAQSRELLTLRQKYDSTGKRSDFSNRHTMVILLHKKTRVQTPIDPMEVIITARVCLQRFGIVASITYVIDISLMFF